MAQMSLGIGVIVILVIVYVYVLRKIWELEDRRPTEEITPEEAD